MTEPDDRHETDPRRTLALFAFYRSTRAREWVDASGSSMHPLIHPGDKLLVEFGTDLPRLGEIVVFADGGRVVAHRLVRRRRSVAGVQLLTRGDATLDFDRPVRADQTFGVVRGCRRAGDGADVSVAASGAGAVVLAGVSAAAGYALVATHRLPSGVGRPLGRAVTRLAPALVSRTARLAARSTWPKG
jgi:hypothetical protein